MIARANRPRPRIKFSSNSSGTMYLMLPTFTCGGAIEHERIAIVSDGKG